MDETLFRVINGLSGQFEMADWFMLALAQHSNLFLPGVLVLAYWLWMDTREALVGSLVLGAVVVLIDFVGAQVKYLAARSRPCQVLEHEYRFCGNPNRRAGEPTIRRAYVPRPSI